MTDKQFQELSERLWRIGNGLQNINSTLSQVYLLLSATTLFAFIAFIFLFGWIASN